MDYPERPEADFDVPHPLKRETISFPATSDLELRGMTTCGHCGHIHKLTDSIVKVYYILYQQQQEHFCSEDCKQAWYIAHLNRSGL